MRWSIGSKIATIFAAILVLLLIVGTVSYTTVRLIDSGGWVTHTRTVILEAEEMLADVVAARRGSAATCSPVRIATSGPIWESSKAPTSGWEGC